MTDEALKPCPFCGCDEIVSVPDSYDTCYMRCSECFAKGEPKATLKGAVLAWNTRAPDEAQTRVVVKPEAAVRFMYRNYRGEVSERHATPISIRFGSTDWHPDQQWLLLAYDHRKGAEREFALSDCEFSALTTEPVDVASPSWVTLARPFARRRAFYRSRAQNVDHPEPDPAFDRFDLFKQSEEAIYILWGEVMRALTQEKS